MDEKSPDNIIRFPSERVSRPPDSQEVIVRKQMQEYIKIDQRVGVIFKIIEDDLLEHMVDPDTFSKDIELVIESIRSLILRQENQDHPLQEIADEMSSFEDEQNEELETEKSDSELPINTEHDPA